MGLVKLWSRSLVMRVLQVTLLVYVCAVFYNFFTRDDPSTGLIDAARRPFEAILVKDYPYVYPFPDRRRLQEIWMACKYHAEDHNDQLPPDLLYLVPEYLPDNDCLADSPEFFHAGERFADLPTDTVILRGKKNRGGKVPVVYADGAGVYLDADSAGK